MAADLPADVSLGDVGGPLRPRMAEAYRACDASVEVFELGFDEPVALIECDFAGNVYVEQLDRFHEDWTCPKCGTEHFVEIDDEPDPDRRHDERFER